ncbi:MAG: dienelactone hydrolase family protein [Acetobacter sp.]|uniref:alpha/beta hydrolase n=1 Tax=Acetobacter sp. TaxID=440 RepID=UPI0039EBB6B3
MHDGLVIFLHGVGSQGADFAALVQLWRTEMPGLRFAAPDGPYPFDMGPVGRQWFSVKNVTQDNRAGRIVAAREPFDTILRQCLAEAGFESRPEQVVLVGFSQGSIMALDVVMSGRWNFAGVVAFSGRLASPRPYTPAVGTPVVLVHGNADPVIPAQDSVNAEKTLSNAGLAAELHVLPGLGHNLSGAGVAIAASFIRKVLGLPPSPPGHGA